MAMPRWCSVDLTIAQRVASSDLIGKRTNSSAVSPAAASPWRSDQYRFHACLGPPKNTAQSVRCIGRERPASLFHLLKRIGQPGRRFTGIRRVQRPAQPRQQIQAGACLESSQHEAQLLQRICLGHAMTGRWCARPGAATRAAGSRARHARSRQHFGPDATPCGRSSSTTVPHPAQQESCVTSLLKVCAASFSPSTIVR